MSWSCAQLEARRDDYLEGRLPAAELRAADTHARACPACGELYEARLAAIWLRTLEPLESPPGLETRILALTVAPPPEESFWAVFGQAWRAVQQPRVAMGLAAAVFSLVLVLNALDVNVRSLELADLNPVALYRGAVRQAHQTYARGARFVNDLRLVYEIRSRLEEATPEGEAPPSKKPGGRQNPPAPKSERNQSNPRNGARGQWLFAQQLMLAGELR
jgi:hypothetical protein